VPGLGHKHFSCPVQTTNTIRRFHLSCEYIILCRSCTAADADYRKIVEKESLLFVLLAQVYGQLSGVCAVCFHSATSPRQDQASANATRPFFLPRFVQPPTPNKQKARRHLAIKGCRPGGARDCTVRSHVGMCDRRGAGPLLPRLARSAPPGTRTPYLPHQLARAAPACPPSLARSLSRAPRRRAGGEGRAGARWSSACSGRARGWWWS
jgi:hypothetical protein